MSHYAGDVVAKDKGDGSPVTLADTEAEEILLRGLREVAPGIPIVAEEAGDMAGGSSGARARFLSRRSLGRYARIH